MPGNYDFMQEFSPFKDPRGDIHSAGFGDGTLDGASVPPSRERPKPYEWFAGPNRLFETVGDIEVRVCCVWGEEGSYVAVKLQRVLL